MKKSKRKSDNTFFDEPPPQKSDVNFTDMNLSRPLLKVQAALVAEFLFQFFVTSLCRR